MITWVQGAGPYIWKSKDRAFQVADYQRGDRPFTAWWVVGMHEAQNLGNFRTADEAKLACERHEAQLTRIAACN